MLALKKLVNSSNMITLRTKMFENYFLTKEGKVAQFLPQTKDLWALDVE